MTIVWSLDGARHRTIVSDDRIRACQDFDEVLGMLEDAARSDFRQMTFEFDPGQHEADARKIWEESDNYEKDRADESGN